MVQEWHRGGGAPNGSGRRRRLERPAPSEIAEALDLGAKVQSVTAAAERYTVRASADDADVVLAAIEGLSDDELNDCAIEGGIRQTEVEAAVDADNVVEFSFVVACGAHEARATDVDEQRDGRRQLRHGDYYESYFYGWWPSPSPELPDHANDNFVLPKYFRAREWFIDGDLMSIGGGDDEEVCT